MRYLKIYNQYNSPQKISYLILTFLGVVLYLSTFSIFPQDTAEKKKVDKDIVSDLKATLSTDSVSVELSWTPPAEEGDVVIARSTEIIDTMEKLGVSDSLGKYKSDKVHVFNSFRDVNLRPGEYYYAIVLVSQVKKKNVKLFPEVNYTITPIVVPNKADIVPTVSTPEKSTPKNFEIDSISNLRIKNVENIVQLTWIPPHDADNTNPKYTIYRSAEPMFNVGLMEKATKIGEVIHPEVTFLDTGITGTQNVYYGVSVTLGDKEKIPLEDNKSFRKFYFAKSDLKKEITTNTTPSSKEEITVIEEKKTPAKSVSPPASNQIIEVKNLTGEMKKQGVAINWTAPEEATKNSTIYYIYESETPILNESTGKLSEKAKRIGTVFHPQTSFLLPNMDRAKTVYYAVTAKMENGEENLSIKEGQSFIKIDSNTKEEKIATPEDNEEEILPAKKKKDKKKKKAGEIKSEEKVTPIPVPSTTTTVAINPTKDELNPDFDTIMAQYYKKDKFREALVKFKSLADRVTDDSMRGKSLFFAGLCHYNLGEFNLALKILLKEEVQMNYDKERVDFYVKRCLENRGSR